MTANSYTIVVSPAAGSVLCLQLIVRTWLAPITKIRDHPLHIPFLDKLISENGPAENPQEIILNSLPCKCLFLWDLSRHRFQPDCLLRPLRKENGNREERRTRAMPLRVARSASARSSAQRLANSCPLI